MLGSVTREELFNNVRRPGSDEDLEIYRRRLFRLREAIDESLSYLREDCPASAIVRLQLAVEYDRGLSGATKREKDE